MKELHWLNFIVYNMFMPMNSKKKWANGGTTEQTRNVNGPPSLDSANLKALIFSERMESDVAFVLITLMFSKY